MSRTKKSSFSTVFYQIGQQEGCRYGNKNGFSGKPWAKHLSPSSKLEILFFTNIIVFFWWWRWWFLLFIDEKYYIWDDDDVIVLQFYSESFKLKIIHSLFLWKILFSALLWRPSSLAVLFSNQVFFLLRPARKGHPYAKR